METLVYTVGELSESRRQAAEQLIGHPLQESQQVRIEISPVEHPAHQPSEAEDRLPEWCNIYEGMSREEIDRLESSILSNRFDLGQLAQ
jgi:hypothetical protein